MEKWKCAYLVNHFMCATKRNTLSSNLVAQNKLEITRLELVVNCKVNTKSIYNIVIMSSTRKTVIKFNFTCLQVTKNRERLRCVLSI